MVKQILPILLSAALLSLPAQALMVEIEPQEGKTPFLVENGLLLGTGESLELDRAPTLAEAIAMTARITAGEAAIRAHAGCLPADTDYTRAVRMEEFLELLLRALGEDADNVGSTADRLALFDSILLSQNHDMENFTGGDLSRAAMAVMAYNAPELFEASLTVDGTEISLGAWGFSFIYDHNDPMWYSTHTARYVPLLDALDALGCGYTLSPGRIDITTEAFAPESLPFDETAPDASLYMLAGAYSLGGGSVRGMCAKSNLNRLRWAAEIR